jgi:hypothetical protein
MDTFSTTTTGRLFFSETSTAEAEGSDRINSVCAFERKWKKRSKSLISFSFAFHRFIVEDYRKFCAKRSGTEEGKVIRVIYWKTFIATHRLFKHSSAPFESAFPLHVASTVLWTARCAGYFGFDESICPEMQCSLSKHFILRIIERLDESVAFAFERLNQCDSKSQCGCPGPNKTTLRVCSAQMRLELFQVNQIKLSLCDLPRESSTLSSRNPKSNFIQLNPNFSVIIHRKSDVMSWEILIPLEI